MTGLRTYWRGVRAELFPTETVTEPVRPRVYRTAAGDVLAMPYSARACPSVYAFLGQPHDHAEEYCHLGLVIGDAVAWPGDWIVRDAQGHYTVALEEPGA